MIRGIVTDKRKLRQPCVLCPEGVVGAVSRDLVDTLRGSETYGVGLAANQIGYRERVVAIRDGTDILVLVNPVVIRLFGGSSSVDEGCLSRPGMQVRMTRKLKARVAYETVCGEQTVRTFRGFVARVVQHELDHLDGILIGDDV